MKNNVIYVCIVIAVFVCTPVILFDIFLNRDIEDISKYKTSDDRCIEVLNKDGDALYKLSVEEFLPLTVAKQIAVFEDEEYIKLYTVLMRTYILSCMGDDEKIDTASLALPYVTYDEMEEAWGGSFYDNFEKYENAVQKTSKICIVSDGKIVLPYFHEVSAGKTRNGSENEALKDLNYLKSVDSNDSESTEFINQYIFSSKEFYQKLKEYRDSIIISDENPLEVVSIVERDSAGYVKTIQVGSTLLSGDEFMACFCLKSSEFVIEEDGRDIIIRTTGVGNGYGLSLYGAKEMIKQGKTYNEVLNYYYNMIELENIK